MEIVTKPVSEASINDFLHFFDDIAFSDNKDWADCYCYFYHFGQSDSEWMKRTGEDNRQSAIDAIKEGTMGGYLAYVDGEPIGWCNVNDKSNYARIASSLELNYESEEKVASIVCFIVAPKFRRMGVATALLATICKDYAQKEYSYLEAYPRRGELTSAQHYHGPASMYARKEFTLFKALEHFDIVRKKLSD